MIEPTPGRIVWFWKGPWHDKIAQHEQPLAATVAYVHNPHMVNLRVVDANGEAHAVTSVTLLQDDDQRPEGFFCEWMPFQKGQAAKYDAPQPPQGQVAANG